MGTASRYRIRTQSLIQLGFKTYDDYLASDLWLRIKAEVLERDRGICKTCGKAAYTAHHVTYGLAVMLGQDLSQLISICRGCHYSCEFKGEKKLRYTGQIAESLKKRAHKKNRRNGKYAKHISRKHRPRCSKCKKQYRRLGRDDICMNCHRNIGYNERAKRAAEAFEYGSYSQAKERSFPSRTGSTSPPAVEHESHAEQQPEHP